MYVHFCIHRYSMMKSLIFVCNIGGKGQYFTRLIYWLHPQQKEAKEAKATKEPGKKRRNTSEEWWIEPILFSTLSHSPIYCQ